MRYNSILEKWNKSIFDTYITYNSENQSGVTEHQINSGDGKDTFIFFEKEGIIAVIRQYKHCVEFCTPEDDKVASAELPAVGGGREAYLDICCGVEDDVIILKFPVYKWVDNYPHCDGEHDRWDTRTVGYNIMKFNLSDKSATIDLFN